MGRAGGNLTSGHDYLVGMNEGDHRDLAVNGSFPTSLFPLQVVKTTLGRCIASISFANTLHEHDVCCA